MNSMHHEAEPMPASMGSVLYVALSALALFGLLHLGRSYAPVSATTVLDAWIILLAVLFVLRGRTRLYVLFWTLVLYFVATRLAPAVVTHAPLVDFLQAYRWLFYLVVLTLASGRAWGPLGGLRRVTWILVVAATCKSAATLVIIGPGERPGLLLENNFELALFCGLAAALYGRLGARRGWLIVILGVLTVLSGSRSGAVIFVVLVLYVLSQSRPLALSRRIGIGVVAVAVSALPVAVFAERSAGSEYGIDRLNFLDVFLQEARAWNLLDWMIGTVPVTALQPDSCRALSYYSGLFSSSGDGSCYAVILHAFLLRVVFDAGIIGLLLSTLLPMFLMRRSGASKSLVTCLTLIALANGASVSGMNNPYVFLPILVVVMSGVRAPDELRAEPAQGVPRALQTA